MKKPLRNPPEQMLAPREGQQRDTEHFCCGQLKTPKSHHYNTGAICREPKGCPPSSKQFYARGIKVHSRDNIIMEELILKMTKLG